MKDKTRSRPREKAVYKNVPIDPQTYERLLAVCEANDRKQGAQVKVWVDTEYEKLSSQKSEDEKEGA